MENNRNKAPIDNLSLLIKLINIIVFLSVCVFIYLPMQPYINAYLKRPTYSKEELDSFTKKRMVFQEDDWDRVEHGIHVRTGMIYDANFKYIEAKCLSCHSAKLITQNRADRNGWQQMIKWMRETQGLQDLGEAEPFILDYLTEHYAPKELGRRPNLDTENIEWYVLELD